MKPKKIMKRMTAAVVLMVLSSTLTFAQPGGGRMNMEPKAMARQTVERLTKELKLDKAQQDSVYQYQLVQGEEMSKLFSGSGGGDRQEIRTKITELQEITDKKISSILSDDQKKAYEKVKASRQNMGGMPGGGRRGGGNR